MAAPFRHTSYLRQLRVHDARAGRGIEDGDSPGTYIEKSRLHKSPGLFQSNLPDQQDLYKSDDVLCIQDTVSVEVGVEDVAIGILRLVARGIQQR